MKCKPKLQNLKKEVFFATPFMYIKYKFKNEKKQLRILNNLLFIAFFFVYCTLEDNSFRFYIVSYFI
jgi:hypothetical protein